MRLSRASEHSTCHQRLLLEGRWNEETFDLGSVAPDSFLGAQKISNEDVLFYQRSSSAFRSRTFDPGSGRSISHLRSTTSQNCAAVPRRARI